MTNPSKNSEQKRCVHCGKHIFYSKRYQSWVHSNWLTAHTIHKAEPIPDKPEPLTVEEAWDAYRLKFDGKIGRPSTEEIFKAGWVARGARG